jgi:hypothetical protein
MKHLLNWDGTAFSIRMRKTSALGEAVPVPSVLQALVKKVQNRP